MINGEIIGEIKKIIQNHFNSTVEIQDFIKIGEKREGNEIHKICFSVDEKKYYLKVRFLNESRNNSYKIQQIHELYSKGTYQLLTSFLGENLQFPKYYGNIYNYFLSEWIEGDKGFLKGDKEIRKLGISLGIINNFNRGGKRLDLRDTEYCNFISTKNGFLYFIDEEDICFTEFEYEGVIKICIYLSRKYLYDLIIIFIYSYNKIHPIDLDSLIKGYKKIVQHKYKRTIDKRNRGEENEFIEQVKILKEGCSIENLTRIPMMKIIVGIVEKNKK